MKTLMDWLNPAAVVDRFDTVRKPDLPDPPGRPDMADVLMHNNIDIEESSIWVYAQTSPEYQSKE